MLTFEANDLAAKIKALRSCAEPRAHIDILKFALLEAGNGEMRLATCNLDRRADAGIPCSGDMPAICVPLWFLDRLAAEKGARVGLKRQAGGIAAFVGRARFDAPTLPASDFPDWSRALPRRVEVDGETLADLFDFVAPAMSSETSRLYFCGALWQPNEESVYVVATDGHRLHWRTTPLQGASGEAVIIPRDVVPLFAGLARDADACVFEWGESGVALTVGGLCVRSKVVDAVYPDWKRVLPLKADNGAQIEIDAAIASLGRVSAAVKASGDRGPAIHLVPHGIGFAVGVGGVAQDVFAGEVAQGLRPFVANADYLLSGLHSLKGAGGRSVTLDMADPGKPAGLEADGVGGGVVLMPMSPLGLPDLVLESVQEREAA